MTIHVKKKTKLNERYPDEDEIHSGKPKNLPRKRPIRDWTKTYLEHMDDSEDVDDFFQ